MILFKHFFWTWSCILYAQENLSDLSRILAVECRTEIWRGEPKIVKASFFKLSQIVQKSNVNDVANKSQFCHLNIQKFSLYLTRHPWLLLEWSKSLHISTSVMMKNPNSFFQLWLGFSSGSTHILFSELLWFGATPCITWILQRAEIIKVFVSSPMVVVRDV